MNVMASVLAWFYVVFGGLELLSNGLHLATGRSRTWGRLQHGDLPPTATDDQVHAKVLRMFAVGAAVVALTVTALTTGTAWWVVAAGCAVALVAAYDAVTHRFVRSTVALAVTVALLVLATVAAVLD